jgi:hypothetical protein
LPVSTPPMTTRRFWWASSIKRWNRRGALSDARFLLIYAVINKNCLPGEI